MEAFKSTQEHEDIRDNGDMCQPCTFEDKQIKATKYCRDCEELLCTSCVAVHGKLKATRHHRIVENTERDVNSDNTGGVVGTRGMCSEHPTEPIKYECVSHNSLICGHCIVEEHGTCNLNILSESVKEFIEGPELKQLQDTIDALSLECDQRKYHSEENMKQLDCSTDKALHEIDKFFERVSTYYIERRDQLKVKVAQLKERMQNDLIHSECEYKAIQKTIQTLRQRLSIDKYKNIELHVFVEARQTKPKLVELKKRISDAEKQSRIDEILFKTDPSTELVLKSDHGLGSVCYKSEDESQWSVENSSEIDIQHVSIGDPDDAHTTDDAHSDNVNSGDSDDTHTDNTAGEDAHQDNERTADPVVKSLSKTSGHASTSTERSPAPAVKTLPAKSGPAATTTDVSRVKFRRLPALTVCTEPCTIYYVAMMSPDSLLISNWTKESIQHVDSRTGSTLSEVSTSPRGPKGICLIGERAAVTMSGMKVQLVHVRGGRLTLGTVLGVKAQPWGVATSGDNVVVSYNSPPWLEVMSPDGSVLHQFQDPAAAQTFQSPQFLTTSSDGFHYVADFKLDTITKLDSSLKVLQTFSDPQLKGPCGITSVGDGQLLVCSWYNNSIVHVNVNSGKMTTILGGDDGIARPRSMAYCPQQRKIFVCTGNETDSIQVYQWD